MHKPALGKTIPLSDQQLQDMLHDFTRNHQIAKLQKYYIGAKLVSHASRYTSFS